MFFIMKTHFQQQKKESNLIQGKSKNSNQPPVSETLQSYKD